MTLSQEINESAYANLHHGLRQIINKMIYQFNSVVRKNFLVLTCIEFTTSTKVINVIV